MDRLAQKLKDVSVSQLKTTLGGLVRPRLDENKALRAEAIAKLKSIQETYFKKKTKEYQGTKWFRGMDTFKVDKRLGAKSLYSLQHQLISFVNKYIYRQSEETSIEYVIYYRGEDNVVRRITTNSLEDYTMTKSSANIGINKTAITAKISSVINQELTASEKALDNHYKKFTKELRNTMKGVKSKYIPEAHELEFQIEHQGDMDKLQKNQDHSWPKGNLPKYYAAAKLNLPWYIAQDYFNIQVKGAASLTGDKVYSRKASGEVDASFSITNIQTIEYLFSFLYNLLTSQNNITRKEQSEMIEKAAKRFERKEAKHFNELANEIKKDGGQIAKKILTK